MPIDQIITYSEWFFIISFVLINCGYLMMSILALGQLKVLMQTRLSGVTEKVPDGLEMPVSILVPAHNEATSITTSIHSMLHLDYPEYEIIVINDGSVDKTLDVLKKEFDLKKVYEDCEYKIKTAAVRDYYQSLKYKNVRVIDKENGGKADSLNAGINASRHSLFCSVDADSVLNQYSLRSVIQPFLTDPEVIASGGSIRIANGCKVKNGTLIETGVPTNPLALTQVVEYLHSFLFGRLGWVPLNSLLILSGAFSLFKKEYVIHTGGYNTDTVGEDMELVVRLHKYMRQNKQPYKITFVPEPICWTEAPQDLKTLRQQRIRWQRGLGETLSMHYDMFLNLKMGAVGMVAFPFVLFFEFLSPIIEIFGYLFFIISYFLGVLDNGAITAFLIASIALGTLISISAILLEEMGFQIYRKKRYLLMLFIGAIIENIGYRQLNAFWRFTGLMKFMFNSRLEWGKMKRHGSWDHSHET